MLIQPPDLPNSLVAEIVESAWAISVESIQYAPVGFGSHHWRISGGERDWFVSVDVASPGGDTGAKGAAERLIAALAAALSLNEFGLTFVIAPVAMSSGEILAPIGDRYLAALYPFVNGRTFEWGRFPDAGSRLAMLDRLVALHTAPLEVATALLDDFVISARHRLEAALDDTASPWNSGPLSESLRGQLQRHRARAIERLAEYDRLAAEVSKRRHPFVVTHGEPHPGNMIDTGDRGLVLVDWDTALLAPPERDLWWLAAEDPNLVGEYESRVARPVDAAALDLYRLRWDLSDLALYTAQLRDPHNDDAEARVALDAVEAILSRLT